MTWNRRIQAAKMGYLFISLLLAVKIIEHQIPEIRDRESDENIWG